jgi:dihydroflavonol-4-reductase
LKTVLVTGITGFLGSHIAVKLLQRGYAVRGSLRDSSRMQSITNTLGKFSDIRFLELCQAELLDPGIWADLFKDVYAVIHVASPVPIREPKDPESVLKPAIEGLKNVLQAALDARVERFIMTSSVAAIGYGKPAGTFTEDDWSNLQGPGIDTYIRSKTRAEKLAWEMVEESRIHFATVNPVVILGQALEEDTGSSLEMIKRFIDGSLPMYPNLGFNMVDAEDTAMLHILAMEKDEANRKRFIAASNFLHAKDFVHLLKKYYPELPIPSIQAPDWLLRFGALFIPELALIVRNLGKVRRFDSSQAQHLLGWKARSAEEAVLRSAESLLELGIVS